MSDRIKIRNAFAELRKLGWYARMRFWCCSSCGCAAVPESYYDKFVFYHAQDAESLDGEGNLDEHGMYLTHGKGGNSHIVCDILRKHGLGVEWDGDMGTRILVTHISEKGL